MSVTDPIEQPSTGYFYAENGAVVNRLNDRVFVAAATVNSGNPRGVGSMDWLESDIPNTTSTAQFTVLSDPGGLYAGIFGVRASDQAETGTTNIFGLGVFGLNDATFHPLTATVIFAEGRHNPSGGALGSQITITAELDSIVSSGQNVGYIDPFLMYESLASATLWLASGDPSVSCGDASVAIGIISNSGVSGTGRYSKGIVIDANAIMGTTASSPGASCAIALASGHQAQWFSSSGVVATSITSVATTGNGMSLGFVDFGAFFTSGGSNALEIVGVSGGVNFLQIYGSSTGNGVKISPSGLDSNIDLILTAKGSGGVQLGPYAATAPTPTGYILVKDYTGVERKLLCA
ncbi:MAG: hypothetical protein KGL12_00900 [Rhodospirillales bacterium]|nr:hypothetical protein [Rhodospirillales bacterium]